MQAYLQIFSMTDHTTPLQGRYQGPYQGMNAGVTTSEMEGNTVRVSTRAKVPGEPRSQAQLQEARVILSYRHSDTGELSGTSESLQVIDNLPWREIPGLEVLSLQEDGTMVVKLWMQEITLAPGRVTRVHFAKTIVYLKNFGPFQSVESVDEPLVMGASQLHAEGVDDNVTLAPDTGSALVVKMGQEIEH